MGRTLTGATQKGVIKSIQHITGTQSVNGTNVDVTISAVNTSNSIIVSNSEHSGEYGDNDDNGRSWGFNSPAKASFTSSTNVRIDPDDLGRHGYHSYGTRSATFYGSVIEYEL